MRDYLSISVSPFAKIAVVAVMCKPHRCPHIAMTGNICVYVSNMSLLYDGLTDDNITLLIDIALEDPTLILIIAHKVTLGTNLLVCVLFEHVMIPTNRREGELSS